jgi:hypothetical protein
MKCKKVMCITLVAFLVITSLSAVASARFSIFPKKYSYDFEDIGEIILPSDESKLGVKIRGVEGFEYNHVYYKYYRPLNLPSEFYKNGMLIDFNARVAPIFRFATFLIPVFSSVFSRNSLILPIFVYDVKKYEEPQQPNLEFDIQAEEKYSVEGPIFVKAVLTNIGREKLTVCDMGLELGTLDFIIERIDHTSVKTYHYIGPAHYPEPVELEPHGQGKIIIEYDLKALEHLFGNEKEGSETPDIFRFEEGVYKIKGVYTSFDLPQPSLVNPRIWKGKLESHSYDFTIVIE